MSFLQPILAAALAIAAVPFLLHLFARRKYTDVPFTALLFLKQSRRSSLRRLTLHHLLVLLCRAAAVAALALAFMLPAAKGKFLQAIGGRSRVALAVVLDNSWSMGWKKGGVSEFERARAAAVKTLAAAGRDDELIVVTPCGSAATEPISSRAGGRDKLAEAVSKIKLSNCSNTLTGAVNRATYEMERAGVPDRRVAVFTDMQSRALAGRARLPEDAPPELTFVDFGAAAAVRDNIGVKSVSLPEFAVEGDVVPICFELHGGANGTRSAVSLRIGGRPRGEQTVTISRNDRGISARGCFRPAFDSPGWKYGELSLQGDSLSQDNVYYFAFEVQRQLKVLLLSDSGSLDNAGADAFYIDRALRAAAVAGAGAVPFVVRAVAPDSVTVADLADSRVVIVPAGVVLPQSAAEKLRNFAIADGGLFIISDGRDIPGETTGRLFFGGDIVLSSPGEERGAKGETARLNFVNAATFDAAHPAFADFSGRRAAEIASTRFYEPGRLVVNSAETRVLLRLSDGNPVLVERTLGAGRVVLLACGVNPYSSNISLKPYFVPFIARMVRRLGGSGGGAGKNFWLGEDVVVNVHDGAAHNALVAKPLAGGRRLIEMNESPGDVGGVFRAATMPGAGAYAVVAPAQPESPLTIFAVNHDLAEGDLSRTDKKAVSRTFAAYPVRYYDAGRTFPAQRVAAWAFNKDFTYLWIPFALLSMCFMALDTFISNRR